MLLNSREQVEDIFLKLDSTFREIFAQPGSTLESNAEMYCDSTTDMDRLNPPGTGGIVRPVNQTSVCPWPAGCGCPGTPYQS